MVEPAPPEPSNKPVLQRDPLNLVEETQEPAGQEVGVGIGPPADRNVVGCGGLVETPRQQPVVLDVARPSEQAGGDDAVGVSHDRLVDLHFVGRANLLVVALVDGRVGVIVVAGDRAVWRNGARLEDGPPTGVADRDVEPHTARRVAGR
ncbi:MAG TPA: hypothetical protein EYQ83_09990 [Acidobacteria bacterium]|nr:hypothetical protein [Acidobacteriota bacterium]